MESEREDLATYRGVTIRSNSLILGGQPIVDGHRITVKAIADHHNHGVPVSEIAEGYGLTEDKVKAALDYYRANREAIDQAISEDEQFWRERRGNPTPLERRIREARSLPERSVTFLG